jgi:hypothetical protein
MNIEFPEGMKVGYELEFCSNATIPLSISRPLNDWFELGVDRSLAPRNRCAHMYEIRSRKPMKVVSVDVIQLMLEQLALVNNLPHDDYEMPQATSTNTWNTSTNTWNYRGDTTNYSSSSGGSVWHRGDTPISGNGNTYPRVYDTDYLGYGSTLVEAAEALVEAAEEIQRIQSFAKAKNIFTTRNCGMHVHISWENKRMAHIFYGHLARVLTEKVKPFAERKAYCCPDFDSSRGTRYNALRWVQVEDGHFEVRLFNGTMKLRGILNSLRMIRNEALLVARASQAAVRTQSANFHG